LVAGAKRVCTWKPENQVIRVSSASVISWISQKGEFSRKAMEIALGLNEGQAYWFITDLIKKGIIKRTNKIVKRVGKGQRQAIYKHLGK